MSDSLWARYHKETEGHQVIETDVAFIRFVIDGDICYIHDLYVIPEARRLGWGTRITDQAAEVALKAGCRALRSAVCVKFVTGTEAMMANLSYGFRLVSNIGDMTFLEKVIGVPDGKK